LFDTRVPFTHFVRALDRASTGMLCRCNH